MRGGRVGVSLRGTRRLLSFLCMILAIDTCCAECVIQNHVCDSKSRGMIQNHVCDSKSRGMIQNHVYDSQVFSLVAYVYDFDSLVAHVYDSREIQNRVYDSKSWP